MACESETLHKLSLSQQWMTLASNDDLICMCDNVESCICIQRLLLIMDIYSEQQHKDTDNMYDVITGQLNYDIPTFINDYHHFKYNHLINDDHYEYIFNQLNKCIVNDCQIIIKNKKKPIISNTTEQKTNNDATEVALLQILDSIHSTIYHQYDLFRYSQNDKRFEFVKKQKNTLLSTNKYQRISEFLKSRQSVIDQLRGSNNRKSKFLTIVINNNADNTDDTENKYDDELSDTINNPYHFGFCYVLNCDNESHKHTHHTLSAKYRNIKEEMLNNAICKIPLKIWNAEQMKARYLQKTNKSKSKYMLTSNILSVLLYCNMDDLQSHLKKTYRLISAVDTEEKARERYREYVHWADKLRETVYKFGRQSDKAFYHGINQQIMIEDASIYFYSPISTTINPVVAHQFSSNDGIIISIDGMENKFLDCSWLSDFEYENEYLFMEGYQGNLGYKFVNKLRILGVIDCKTGINYNHFFGAMNFLNDNLFIKSPLSCTFRKERKFNKENIDNDTEKALRILVNYRLNNNDDDDNDNDNDEPSMEYIYTIFDMYCSSKDNITIEAAVCEYMMNLTDREKGDIDVFMQLFPNVAIICLLHWNIHHHLHTILKLIDKYINIEMIGFVQVQQGHDVQMVSKEFMDTKVFQRQLRKRYWGYYLRCGDIILSSMVIYKHFESVQVSESFITTIKSEVNPFPVQYAVYKIIVQQNGKEYDVNKRYSEFYDLYQHLKWKGYSSISEFPSKTWMSSSGPTTVNDDFLKHRLSALNKWIQEVFEKSVIEDNIGWTKDLCIFLKSYVIKGSYTEDFKAMEEHHVDNRTDFVSKH